MFCKDSFVMYDKDFIKRNDLPDKLLLVMAYLRIYCAKNGCVGTSINLICEKIGYKPNRNKGKINSQIIDALKWLKARNFISLATNLDEVVNNNCFFIEINNDPNIYDLNDNYVILTESEFDKITKSNNDKKRNKQDLLKVFLNIKKYMSFDKHNLSYCYPSHITLCRDCNISSTGVINNIIDELKHIGLLYTYNSGRYKDHKGNIKYTNNFYALEKDVLKPEMCDEIIKNYYLSLGVTISEFI